MLERRHYVRIKTALPVRYGPVDRPEPLKTAVTTDVGINGIGMVVGEKLAVGTRLRLEIGLPDVKKPAQAIGKVIWQDDAESGAGKITGIEYIDVDSWEIEKLTNFVLNHLKGLLSDKHTLLKTLPDRHDVEALFHREIRLPGDNSPAIKPPDFLTHEITIPGDMVRYCRIQSGMLLKYSVAGGAVQENRSLCQYVSGGAVWLLLDQPLKPKTVVKLRLDIPNTAKTIITNAQVESSVGRTYCDDKHTITLFETKIRFTDISQPDRAQIIRYVYSCRRDYFMLGKHPPSEWI